MLVLSRQRDQAIMIGDDVEISVVDVRGDKVRLGISAPRNISVHRKEIYTAIRDENYSAAAVQPQAVASLISPPPPPLRLVRNNVSVADTRPPGEVVAGESLPIVDSSLDKIFMQAAIAEGQKSVAAGGMSAGEVSAGEMSMGGVCAGAVLVRGNQIIAAGHDRRQELHDPVAYAVIDCLRNAGLQKSYQDTALYTTAMPCLLGAAALIEIGIPRLCVAGHPPTPAACKCVSPEKLLIDCGVELVTCPSLTA